MQDQVIRHGGCACGTVRYRLRTAPMFVQCCHCFECQRSTGGAFVINALIEADQIETTAAPPEPVAVPTTSGRPHDVYRCPSCRIAMWSDYGRRGVMQFVRVGTLDQPHSLQPDAHIFTLSKVPWVKLPDDVPAFPVYYDMHTLWPASSLARRRAILGNG